MSTPNASLLLTAPQLLPLFSNPKAPVLAPNATVARDTLLQRSKSIERVVGATSQNAAVVVMGDLQTVLNSVEADRKVVKKPFLDACKAIDAAASGFLVEVEAEKARLKRLVATFQAEEIRKAEAARRAQEAELARLQKERLEAEAAARLAQTQEEQAKAQEQMLATDVKAAEVVMQPVAEPRRAEGLVVKYKWVVVVNDPDALYKVYPELVKLEPRMREIQAAVKKHAETEPDKAPTLPGCTVTREIDAQTR